MHTPSLRSPRLVLGGSAALMAALLGTLVLFGWHLGNVALIQVSPGFVPMQYNTALGFLLTGAGLLSLTFERPRLAVICGTLVGMIGAATLAEYLAEIDLGIDQVFMLHYVTVETSHPGRMAPNTALCFVLSALAVVLHGALGARRDARSAVGALGALIVGLGVVAIAGYAANLEGAYGWGDLTRMAVHTAGGFVAVGLGLMGVSWEAGEESGFLPEWLSSATAIGVTTGTVALWQAIHFGSLDTVPQNHPIHTVHHAFLLFGLALSVALSVAIRMAQRARRQEAAIRRANAELERFAQIASHDLQEPLRTITTYLQLLERRYGERLDPEAVRCIDFAVDGAGRMRHLIRDLLHFARLKEEKLVREHLSMNAALDNVVREFEAEISETGATVTIDPGLPAVSADPALLDTLLRNLIGNALKYRVPGQGAEVHIGMRRERGHVEFFVADKGIGIEPQYREKIFDVFQRLHTQQAYPGTGIGLAICQRVIERHGGALRLESKPGEGSTFLFSL